MILTPHTIVGAVIANITPTNPALGFSMAFASHYLLDMLPHVDYDITHFLDKDNKSFKIVFGNTKSALHLLAIILDFFIGLTICLFLFVSDRRTLYITLVGVAGGVLPDIFQFLYFKFKVQPFIFFQKVHDKIHYNIEKNKNGEIWGIIMQIAIPIIFVTFYFLYKKFF